MKKSYMNSQLRKYKETHPWAKKLPKSMLPKGKNRDDMPIDLGVINIWEDIYAEEEAKAVGDGSWAVVYDESREGEWLWDLADNGWVDHICSECRYAINTDFHVSINKPRCPRCGAKMVKNHGIKITDTAMVLY